VGLLRIETSQNLENFSNFFLIGDSLTARTAKEACGARIVNQWMPLRLKLKKDAPSESFGRR
jgi:hypothetical protein